MLENLLRKLLLPAFVVGVLGGCGPKRECEKDEVFTLIWHVQFLADFA